MMIISVVNFGEKKIFEIQPNNIGTIYTPINYLSIEGYSTSTCTLTTKGSTIQNKRRVIHWNDIIMKIGKKFV